MSRLLIGAQPLQIYNPIDPYTLSSSLGEPYMRCITHDDCSSEWCMMIHHSIPGPLRPILELTWAFLIPLLILVILQVILTTSLVEVAMGP